MSISQYEAPPFEHQARVVQDVTTDYECKEGDDIVFGRGSGITVKLPANPVHGKRITIGANTAAVIVDGNGHTIAGTLDNVLTGREADFTFSGNDVWVSSCCTNSPGPG